MPIEVIKGAEKHFKFENFDEAMNTEDIKTNKSQGDHQTDMPRDRDGIGDPCTGSMASKSDLIGSDWGLKGCEMSEMSLRRRSLYQLERLYEAATGFYWPGTGVGGAGCGGLVRAIQVLLLAGCVYPGYSRASEMRHGR